jgi:hypothetical protein
LHLLRTYAYHFGKPFLRQTVLLPQLSNLPADLGRINHRAPSLPEEYNHGLFNAM